MGALGDQEAEVEGGASDALGGALVAVRPHLTGGRGQFHPELLGRRGQSVHPEGEVARPHPEPGHMPEPVGGWAHHTQGVGDVQPVGPGLHQPGRGHGGGGHGRAVPGETGTGRCAAQGPVEGGTPVAPGRQQLGGREYGALLRSLVHERAGCGERLLDQRLEGAGVGDRQQGRAVGPGEVRDLVGDGPAGRGGGQGPPLRAQLGHELVEFTALGTQVVDDGRRVGHGGSMAAGPETIKRACMNWRPAGARCADEGGPGGPARPTGERR